MRHYVVTVTGRRRLTVTAPSVVLAEAVALSIAEADWPGCDWLVSDTEEEL